MEDTAQKYAEEARARDTKREKACGSSQSAKRPEKKKTRFGSTISKILKPGMKFEDQLVWKHNEDLGRYIWGIVVSCKRNNLFRTGGRGAIISYTLIVDFEETKETVTLKYPDGEFFCRGSRVRGMGETGVSYWPEDQKAICRERWRNGNLGGDYHRI
mmetsp:Transcript_35730/g.81653  ORF Transcript_35730/g.81653 Transcript_35730/m.81653 type:complete len:158 (+) Transcript_35730:237-710(+)